MYFELYPHRGAKFKGVLIQTYVDLHKDRQNHYLTVANVSPH